MKFLNPEEEATYSKLADTVAYVTFTESLKSVQDLPTIEDIDTETTLAVSNAVSEISFDKLLELTKDMSKEQIVKFLTTSISTVVMAAMNQHPEYTLQVMTKGMRGDFK